MRPLFLLLAALIVAFSGVYALGTARSSIARAPSALVPELAAKTGGSVNFVICDAHADADDLALIEKPSFFEKTASVLMRGLGLKPAKTKADTLFTETLIKDPAAILWTHNGFYGVSPEQMSFEIERAAVKAAAAGLRINIMTYGASAAPALKAAERLEKQGVTINKLINFKVNLARLTALDRPYFENFKKPENVRDWANIWLDDATSRHATFVEYRGASPQVASFEVELFFPELTKTQSDSLREAIFEETGKVLASSETMDARSEAAARRLQGQAEGRTWKSHDGHYFKKEAPQGDSLSFLKSQSGPDAGGQQSQPAASSEHCQKSSYGGPPVEWIKIPSGTIYLYDGKRASPASFDLAKTKTTYGQYCQCVRAGACSPPRKAAQCLPPADEHPVVCINWSQANDFAKWVGGRLPTRSEWFLAGTSGGLDVKFPWGNEPPNCDRAICDGGCGKNSTWPVCSKPKGNTKQGLCDMAGNAQEWLADAWSDEIRELAGTPQSSECKKLPYIFVDPRRGTLGAETSYNGTLDESFIGMRPAR